MNKTNNDVRYHTMNQPVLQFDFQPQPICFTNPNEVIQTNKLAEVEQCLQQIDAAVQHGSYAAGYLSYEVTYAFLNGQTKPKPSAFPLLWFGIFDEPITEMEATATDPDFHIGPWKMKQSQTEYKEAFSQIVTAIHSGNIDQVNYTVPFETSFTGNAYSYYERLKKAQHASYSAYLQLGDIEILSASPELFFQVDDEHITLKPMKGTIHRGKSYMEDVANKSWLQSSKKNQHENELIIHLMKQELVRFTEPSSIYIPKLFEVEQYPTVFQMTSTLKGTLLPEVTMTDIIKGLFPCGSISGVPKKAALECIHQIEPYPRDIYCGAIGYITPNRKAIFNVPIRTVTVNRKNNKATYGAGGAITAESNIEEEYQEMLTKTKVLEKEEQDFKLLETIGLIDGTFIVLQEHLTRLQQSAIYFQYPLQMNAIKAKLHTLAKQHPSGRWRVRLTVSKTGEVTIEYEAMEKLKKNRVALAQEAIQSNNIFHYHKTTNRCMYDRHGFHDDLFDVLLWNEKGELTEFTIGNLVVELDGKLYTPPIHCGVLPGTYRAALLAAGEIDEKVIHKSELSKVSRIWFINSVRQWVEVYFETNDIACS